MAYTTLNQKYGVTNQNNPDQSIYTPTSTVQDVRQQHADAYAAGSASTAGREARAVQTGTSGADEDFMSNGDYAILQQLREQYNAATDQAARNALHDQAEAIRNHYGYSGGGDGSQYIYLGSDRENDAGGRSSGTGGGSAGYGRSALPTAAPNVSPMGAYHADTTALRNYLDQWKADATSQYNNAIDHNVQQAVTQLERALEDAQPQFREQQEAIARDERQGMDNSALYAELRGDRGGIGQSQYNEVQAAAARNRQAVQTAQVKLATDSARQIEDLRAQGEFQKADAALQVSQQYLQQLMSLEQWAQEYNLSADQFEASLLQWQANYEASMAQFNANMQYSYDSLAQNQSQFNSQMGYNYASLAQNQAQFGASLNSTNTLNAQKQLAGMGQAMLSAGIMPTTEQLSVMGLTQSQAEQYIAAAKLEAASKQTQNSGGSSAKTSAAGVKLTYSDAVDTMYKAGVATEAGAKSWLLDKGYSTTEAASYAKSYAEVYKGREKEDQARNASGYANFNSMMTGLTVRLQQGISEAELEGIVADKWYLLSDVQRRQLQNTLARYGYAYDG